MKSQSCMGNISILIPSLNHICRYFRAGADKVSIGSDAVYAVEEYSETGQKTGTSSIEMISQ